MSRLSASGRTISNLRLNDNLKLNEELPPDEPWDPGISTNMQQMASSASASRPALGIPDSSVAEPSQTPNAAARQ